MTHTQTPLSFDDCYSYIEEKVFPLRPKTSEHKQSQGPGLVGVEIEMLPLWSGPREDLKPQPVRLHGEKGLVTYLESLRESQQNWKFNYAPGEEHYLLNIQLEDQDQLSFEPGGQLEFSTRPYPSLVEASQRMTDIQGRLDRAAQAFGLEMTQIGMNPWASVEAIGLQMTKPRYRAMTQYYSQFAPEGLRMMRQTCTIQVNLDFGSSEEVMAKRFLASNLVAPFATAIFANSPFVDGRATALLSNRGRIWQQMDPTHTGFPELENVVRFMDRRSCVESYLNWVQNGHVVFIEDLDFKVMDGRFSFRDWVRHGYQGVKPCLRDLQTHLSLQFPEVRARGFVELRSMDCQHRVWQDVPAAFYAGLLYDEKSLNGLLDELLPLRSRLYQFWQESVYGLQSTELAGVAKRIGKLAVDGLVRLPQDFLGGDECSKLLEHFLDRFTFRGLSPANLLLDKGRNQPQGIISMQDLESLAAEWLGVIGS